jgi:amylosucrase
LGQGLATNKECEIAYHNVLMVTLWSALAERKVTLMTHVLGKMPPIPSQTAWATYVRCHDDIGWAITEEDAAGVGLNGFSHRAFLSDFYSGNFAGTFSRGGVFQFNPDTGDRRINGSCASLAGLEKAIELGDGYQIYLAIQRILLIHSVIFAFGGIPLIYMGDEIGLLNDYEYAADPDHAEDSRWLHRPNMDWALAEKRADATGVRGQIFKGLQNLVQVRGEMPAFHAQANTIPVWTHNDHVFGLIRQSPRGQALVLANFSEQQQVVSGERLSALGFGGELNEHLQDQRFVGQNGLKLTPYQRLWLTN